MEKNTPLYLPHELIVQILQWLPVKSLIRVCKSWFSLISDSHFAKSHYELAAAAHTRRVLLKSWVSLSETHEFRSLDFEASFNNDFASTSVNINFMPPQSYSLLRIKCSCRGFILLTYYSKLYLWNPFTGFHKKIPLSPIHFDLNATYSYSHSHSYGFGYDQSTDDYLVVSISYDKSITLGDASSRFEFFSLRANAWKEIEGTIFPYTNRFDGMPKVGSLCNGAIHWLARRRDLYMNDVIVAFDLMGRKLIDMHMPENCYIQAVDCGLWIFGEFLSLLAMNNNSDELEIWVMKEYNVNSSWTKTLVLPIDPLRSLDLSTFCCTKSGDIVGTDGLFGLVKYDDKGQLLEYNSNYYSGHGCVVAMYTESLLSLPGDTEHA